MKCSNVPKEDIGRKMRLSKKYVIGGIEILDKILRNIKDEILKKYSKYTKELLIHNTFDYLFKTPLLKADKVCKFKESGGFYFNTEYLQEVFPSLASSEQLLLVILIQQFSGSIIDGLTKFNNLPMLAHIQPKEKLYFIIELFDNYPLLFQN